MPKEIDDEDEDLTSGSQQVPVDNYGLVTSEKESTARENNVAKIKVVVRNFTFKSFICLCQLVNLVMPDLVSSPHAQVRKRPLNRKELSRKEEDIITVHDSSFLTVYEPKLKVYLWIIFRKFYVLI